ncbi:protein THALLO [Arachis duranensis]|uniref:Protein THALLO n=1 Tax=Arachis duranensis TaxID=130453 RepID=A0A6P4BM08_ARADU|nr:protein THALLO [Arachis duranensis]
MGKKGGGKSFPKNKKAIKNDKKGSRHPFSADDMDDEIDAFNKQRDIIPLDVNADAEESDEDDEVPVFDKGIDDSEDEVFDDDEEEDDEDADDDLSKMIRQRKYLRAKFGTGEDDMHDDEEEEDEDNKLTWGGKRFAHGAENRNFELQSSDDEDPKEEEKLALQQQKDKAKYYTMEDYGLADISEGKDDEIMTFEDASDKGKGAVRSPDRDITFTVEDLKALSKEEQMNILHRSAPDLVGWLSELNEAHEQLEAKVNPFLSKAKAGELDMKGVVRYFELKQLLLLSYCQAITFYLLLKSEGQPVHDHPVMARLDEIKSLLDQIKQLDTELPFELEDILKGNNGSETVLKNAPTTIDSFSKEPSVFAKSQEEVSQKSVETEKFQSSKDHVQKARKDEHQKASIGVQSLEMLKVRASLEEKLKQKGLYSSIAPKSSGALKRSRPVNGRLETYDDFVDDTADVKGAAGLVNGSNKVAQYLNANLKKLKVISGDDDLPKRDDIGERRRKHELRVMAGAGVQNEDDNGDDYDDEVGHHGSDDDANEEDDFDSGDSENEFYKQVEQQRNAKLAAKAQIYSRKSGVVTSMPETIEGKRQITSQMAKNRGLTRIRNKAKKNPRKNYKLKHQKALKKRQGQVQSIRKPTGPYGGEATGINPFVSRSIRFKD